MGILLKPCDYLPYLDRYDYSPWLTDKYYFDREAVVDVIDFSRECKGTIGDWAGVEFEFLPWQLYRLVVPVFGIKRKDNGLRRFRQVLFFVPRKNGKALELSTPILTPMGWRTMEELRPGDQVFDEHGSPCNVVAATEPMTGRPCYRVRFSDGLEIVADRDHQWITHTCTGRGLWTTEQIYTNPEADHTIWDYVEAPRSRQIVAVEPVDSVPVKCIQVDSRSRLYLAGKNLIPTHNSGLMSVLTLYLTGFDGEPRAFVYGVAKNKDQAGIVFNESVIMVDESEWLSDQFHVYSNRSDMRIKCPLNRGEYRVLSKDAKTKDGLNAHGVCADEIQEYELNDEKVISRLHSSRSTRRQPLEFYFGTMGVESSLDPYWKRMYKRGKKALEVPDKDPYFYPLIYEAPKGCDIHDRKVWAGANPSYPDVKTDIYMEEMAAEAELSPSAMSEFLRLDLNIPTFSEKLWIEGPVWERNASDHTWESLLGRPCYAGVDLAATRDFTAVGCVFPPFELDPFWRVLCKLWLPQKKLEKREKAEEKPYTEWAKSGLLVATEGDVVDYQAVLDFLLSLYPAYDLKGVAFDPWGAENFIQTLKNQSQELEKVPKQAARRFWRSLEPVAFRQGFKSFSEPCKKWEIMLYQDQLKHDGNPILGWMQENVVVVYDPAHNMKMDKEKSTDKIDGIVASVMGFGLALATGDTFDINDIIRSRSRNM